MKFCVILLTLAWLVVGCGEDQEPSARAAEPSCKIVAADYRVCGLPTGESVKPRPHLDRREGDSWREIAGPRYKRSSGSWHGHWRSLHVAPDGRTLLATWSGECEVPTAYFLPAEGGELRPAAGEVESVGLGWSKTGEARIELLGGLCGHGAKKPGVYLVDPTTGARKFVEGPLKGPMPLKGS
jgi:hypothetical protein